MAKRGFTLIELMVVIAIIGILTTLLTIALGSARLKARDTERVSDVSQIRAALELYYQTEGAYPSAVTVGNAIVGPTSGKTYLAKVPSNPTPWTEGACTTGTNYTYTSTLSNNSYNISYCLAGSVNDVAAGYRQAHPRELAAVSGAPCVPNCAGLDCGDNGCGGSCGTCTGGNICTDGSCVLDPKIVLLLHMNGSDNGTTFTDSSPYTHTVSATNAVTKTAVQKFGTASAYFDGNQDYLTSADSADWDMAAGDFAMDAWVRGAATNNGTGFRPVAAHWEQQVSTEFTTAGSWSTYDAGTVGTNTKGYFGAVFDGRYVYYVPQTYDGTNYHGKVLRYDTQGGFTTAGSWSSYDAGAIGGLTTKGYAGASYDGRYIYFAPYWNGSAYHGKILRYDTQGAGFTDASSWASYNAENEDGTNTIKGYFGSVFDGRYVYFVPYYNGSAYHGKVLRFDTQGTFSDAASWDVYNAGAVGGADTKGYFGAIFDGQYIYFSPSRDSTGASHGRVMRYDTQADFATAGSWAVYDAGSVGTNTKGYAGGAFDGRYVYFTPYYDTSSAHGKVLRYDTAGAFTTAGNWASYDAGGVGTNTKGYWGAVYDGQYVWFVPYFDGSAFHAKVLRYHTNGAFTTAGSWSTYDAGSIGTNTKGYAGAVFDGRYIYFSPYREAGSTFHAKALRYDTKSNTPAFKLVYGDLSYDGGLSGGPIGPSFYFNIGSFVYGLHAKQILSANTWYHLAVTRESNSFKLYVDGVLKDSQTVSGTIDNGTDLLTIGNLRNGGNTASFNGYIDELRLYKGGAYWTAAFTPPTSEY